MWSHDDGHELDSVFVGSTRWLHGGRVHHLGLAAAGREGAVPLGLADASLSGQRHCEAGAPGGEPLDPTNDVVELGEVVYPGGIVRVAGEGITQLTVKRGQTDSS